MIRPLPSEDTQPWYRQFWPWFLILLPASVVVAGLTTLVLANRHADDLVVDDYYKDGLAINRKLEKQQRADQQGISVNPQNEEWTKFWDDFKKEQNLPHFRFFTDLGG